jgi:DNA-binding MarR family transcriptional regulator
MAALALFAYGALWSSVRGQHPYRGPSTGVILLVYASVLVIVVASVTMIRHATSGVSGPSVRRQRAYSVAYAAAYIAEAVFQGALKHDGFSNAIVYGVFPAAAPLLVVGGTLAGMAAANENWRLLAVAIAVVARLRRTHQRLGSHRRRRLRHARRLRRQPTLGASPAPDRAGMTDDVLDPLIHVPARLRIVATLAALPAGDALSFTRLQDLIGLTAGNLITHLRKLEDAEYLTTDKTGSGIASRTSVALTEHGRAALVTYTRALRDLLNGL